MESVGKNLFWRPFLVICSIFLLAVSNKELICQPAKEALIVKEIENLNELSLSFYYSNSFDSAFRFADSALSLAQSIGNTHQFARALFFRGLSLYRKNQHTQAILDLEKCLHIFEAHNDSVRIGLTANSLGVIYQSMSLHDASINYFNKALAIWLGLKDREETAVALFNVGSILIASMNNFGEANGYLQKLLGEYSDIAEQKQFLSNIYNAKSLVKENFNQSDSAIYYALKAYEISFRENNLMARMYTTYNLANFYQKKNNYTLAKKYSLESLDLRKQMNSAFDIAFGKFQLAEILIKNHDLEEGNNLVDECIEMAEHLDNVEIKIGVNRLISTFYEAKGDYKSAMDAYKVYVALKDSAFTMEKAKHINLIRSLGQEMILSQENELLTKQRDYEKALKQKAVTRQYLILLVTILVLMILVVLIIRFIEKGKLNKRLKASEAQLKKLNHEKNLFFGTLSHDLRSPLMAFESLTNRMAKSDVTDYRELASQMNSYAKELINLLNNVLSWSKIELGILVPAPIAILLEPLIENSVRLYAPVASAKNVEISVNCPENLMVFTDKESLNTILRNLINNAVKFTENGKVYIDCSTDETMVSLSVTDTGIGMSEKQLDSLFDFSKKHHSGLGLTLCKELATKCGMDFTIESRLNKGTTAKLLIPKFVLYEDCSG